MNLSALFKAIGNSPVLKTIASQFVATAAVAVDTAIQNPTGGFAHTLATNPQFAMIYVACAQLTHNFLSKYAPPATPPPATK